MELMRLSKRLAQLGICSRREADAYIEQAWAAGDGFETGANRAADVGPAAAWAVALSACE